MSEEHTAPASPEPQSFPVEYVRELRRENETWRKQAAGHRTDAEAARAASEAAQAQAKAAIEAATKEAADKASAAVSEAVSRADARVIRAELRAAALKAGMVDLDGLKMIETASLKISADGDVEGVDALIELAKTSKPYLFGGHSTSSVVAPPAVKAPVAKLAAEMTDAEFEAAMRNKSYRNR